MLFCGIAIGLALFVVGHNVHDASGFFVCILTGLLFAIPAWLIYRLLRFMFWRRSY